LTPSKFDKADYIGLEHPDKERKGKMSPFDGAVKIHN
jgi:hypothetical protein